MGEEISTHTDPVAYDKGTLYVWVDHPVRMQEMIFMTKELKKKINSYMDPIETKNIEKIVKLNLINHKTKALINGNK